MGGPARPSAVRTLAWGALVGALLGLTGCTATHQAADGSTGGAARAAADGATTGTPGTSAGTGDGTSASSSGAPGSTPASSAAAGREQAPGPAAPPVVTLPGLQAAPNAPAAAPLLTGAAPATAERNGAVVAGFPVKVVPVPKGVTVVSSSVSSEGARVQVGMQASSAATPAEVLGAYDAAFGASGFTPANSPALPGTSAHLYQHGTDGVVVTVKARLGGGTEIAVAGSLTTAG